ncbi:MAG: SDR family NAD(P)-dependent oxidoreductase [Xenococcaceae cyanobacterium]
MMSRKSLCLEGNCIELSKIEAVIRDLPSVKDCTVLVRETETSQKELVAYVVSAEPLTMDQLQSHLLQVLPTAFLPSAYVPISSIPLTSDGLVDKQALTRLPVMDETLRQQWKKTLHSLPNLEEVKVVIQEKNERQLPLHLSELLPEWNGNQKTVSEQTNVTTPVSSAMAFTHTEPQKLALSDGGPLVIEEDAPKTLTDALIQTVRRYQDKGIIYIQPDGSEIFQTYGELLSEAKCILTGLSQMGLKPNDKAILQIENLRDYFPTFWACLLGGITPVTVAVAPSSDATNGVVNKLFNTWKLLNHPPILASDTLIDSLSGLKYCLPMEDLTVLSVSQLRNHPPTAQIHPSHPQEVVFFQLTSGSTGLSKCIQETHHGIICHIHSSKQFNGYQSDDISLNWLPVDHVVPILTYHLKDVYLGCQQVQVPTHLILGAPLKWLDFLEKYRVTHSWSPNFGFKLVSNHLAKTPNRTWDLSSLKFLMNAGEQVTLPVVRGFLELVAPFKLASQVMQPAFGMAEVCTCMTYQNHFGIGTGVHCFKKDSLNGKLHIADEEDTQTATFVDLGSPVPGVQIRIVDNNNQLLPEGVIGRLQIKGDVVTPGYFNNDTANQAAFVGDGWFDTGDLGFILNGRLTLTGREKELIIIHGANYYCYEIEDQICEIEGIEPTYVAACGIDNPETGTEALAIFFTPQVEGIEANIPPIQTIRTKVTANLGINPTYVIPVAKSAFPKTTSGKIQRSKLKQLLAEGYFADVLKTIDRYLENANTLPDWFYRPIWRRKEVIPSVDPIPTGGYLVFLDRSGLGNCLGAQLKQLNQSWIGVESGAEFVKLSANRYQINPSNPDHYRQLWQSLADEGITINQILHLWTYDEQGEIVSLDALEQAQEFGIYSLLFLVQALAQAQDRNCDRLNLLVVSRYVQALHPEDDIAYEKTPILGLCQVISQEMHWLHCRHVDLATESVELNTTYLFQELRTVNGKHKVAYRQGQRFIPRLEKVDWQQETKQELPFRRGGIYLLSGGLGGIGVEIAKYLLQDYDGRLILIGRTVLPARSEWDVHLKQSDSMAERLKAYLELEQLGGDIHYEAVDTCDRAQLQLIVEQAQSRWQGTLEGVIHLAGLFQERLLKDERRESFAAQLRAKVLGTWVLHKLLKDNPQGIFITFSSVVNGMFGGAMSGAYAAANSFLDGFSHYQRSHLGLQSYCFNWSMWDKVGMNRDYPMKDLFYGRGFQPITVEQGLQSLLVGLSHLQPHLVVGLAGENPQIRPYLEIPSTGVQQLVAYSSPQLPPLEQLQNLTVLDRFGTPSTCEVLPMAAMPQTPTGDRKHPASQSPTTPRSEAERQIAQIWQEVLGIPQVGIDDNFFALGGSSLPLIQIHTRLQTLFGHEISIVDLFKYPTIHRFAQHLNQADSSVKDTQPPPKLTQILNIRKASIQRQRQRRQKIRPLA